jgi:hypothetical protein
MLGGKKIQKTVKTKFKKNRDFDSYKQIDKKRNKYKAPLVFADYGENGYPDLSLYKIDLENFKINHEQFYETMIALSKKNKTERAIEISHYKT